VHTTKLGLNYKLYWCEASKQRRSSWPAPPQSRQRMRPCRSACGRARAAMRVQPCACSHARVAVRVLRCVDARKKW